MPHQGYDRHTIPEVTIRALRNRLAFTMVAMPCSHTNMICDFPSWLSTSKVSWGSLKNCGNNGCKTGSSYTMSRLTTTSLRIPIMLVCRELPILDSPQAVNLFFSEYLSDAILAGADKDGSSHIWKARGRTDPHTRYYLEDIICLTPFL